MECPAWLREQPVAHRGLHGGSMVPENSLAAISAAIEHSYAIELDVQITADGEVVVFHDRSLKRLTGLDQDVAMTTAKALSRLNLAGTAERIPLFSDVLALVADRAPLLVEIKNEAATGRLEQEVVRLVRGYDGDIALQSFHAASVRWCRKHLPSVACGQISGSFQDEEGFGFTRRFIAENILLEPYVRPDFIAYELDALTPARHFMFSNVYRLPLLLWTIRSEADAKRAASLGANLIFEGFHPALPSGIKC